MIFFRIQNCKKIFLVLTLITNTNFMFQPLHLVAKMQCHLDNRGDPFFYLQPVKVEQLHYHPVILMFHDVVSETEMKTVRRVAAPMVCKLNYTRAHL